MVNLHVYLFLIWFAKHTFMLGVLNDAGRGGKGTAGPLSLFKENGGGGKKCMDG